MVISKTHSQRVIFLTAMLATSIAPSCTAFSPVHSTARILPSRSPSPFQSSPSPSSKKPKSTIRLYMGKSLEPLAKEGPWTAYLDDETTGLVYYFNTENGESCWDPPTPSFPEIKLSKRQEERMTAMRQTYNENQNRVGFEEATQSGASTTTTTAEKQDGGGIFGAFFGAAAKAKVEPIVIEEEAAVEEEVPEPAAKPSLFGGLFGGSQNGAGDDEYYDQSMFEDAVVAEDYDQTAFEDAVAVDDGSGPAKKSFVDDIMAFASFPTASSATAKKDEAADASPSSDAFKLEIASKILPHPEKVSWGGEDALFVSGRSFGVFDGVSGAEKLDGVPLYSNTLAQQLKSDCGQGGLSVDELKKKLLNAAEYCDMSATGASTAVVASIGEDNVMRSLCLGDSVLMIIRNGSVFSKTKETLHYFDCPYQLSEDSPDRPRDGTVLTTKLLPGDIIISGSDGVFDNLDDAAVVDIVNENPAAKPPMIAQKIITKSRTVSKDTTAPTPYAKQAKRNRYENYKSGLGGKIDDISCVVVSVSAN
jgi:protein phosphatase PTC7